MNRLILIISSILFLFTVNCAQQHYEEMSDDQIQKILSDVVASDDLLNNAVQRYFSELTSENNNMIKPDKLQEKLQNNEDIYILDIRRTEDYKNGHIPTANNIWWFDIGKNINSLPKNKKIVLTCYSGQSAAQVIGVLRVLGYDAYSLVGGMDGGWLKSGFPTVKE